MWSYGSLFAGAGLLDTGLHEVLPGLDCRFAVELDDDRRRMFGAHFPDAALFADVETLLAPPPLLSGLPWSPGYMPRVSGLVGGIPCNSHSTAQTSSARALAPVWSHVRTIIAQVKPAWTLWESSEKDKSWARWVPAVRRDLWTLGHASLCFRVRTSGRGACHDRQRAFVISWSAASDADRKGQPSRAVHDEVARLRAAPSVAWDGRVPARALVRLGNGLDQRVGRAVGYGVDQRSARDAGAVLGALLKAL